MNICYRSEILSHSDFNHSINNLIKTNWQAQWNNAAFNKLHDIKPYIEPSTQFSQVNRRDQVVLTRCRIGHTKLTHSYLFKNELAPQCIACNEYFNVKHFLIDCHDLKDTRDKYFKVNSLHELFKNIPLHLGA